MPMTTWLRTHYLSFTGRLARAGYIRAYALLFVAVMIVVALGVVIMIETMQTLPIDLLIGPPLAAGRVLLLIGSTGLVVKRFHDLGLPTTAGLIYLAVGAAIAAISTFITGSVLMLLAVDGPMAPGHWIWLVVWLVWFLLPMVTPGMRSANRHA